MIEVETFQVAYDFNRWLYTSSDEDLYVAPVTYRAVPITRSEVKISTNDATGSFTARFPLDSEFLDLFRVSPPSGIVSLLCKRVDGDNPENPASTEIIFKGKITNVQWELDGAEITCESSSQTIKRMGLRRHYQYSCPHMLYGGKCLADRSNFETIGSASNVTGVGLDMVAAIGLPDDYFAGGYIEYAHISLATTERITVASSTGVTITLFSFPVGLASGAEVRAYAGCNRTLDECKTRFDNVANFGGMPFIPTKNPFGSDPLY